VKVALVQDTPRLGDVAANLERTLELLEEAARRGADVALLPELFLTGYRLGDLVPEVALRLDRPGPVLDRLLAASRRIAFALGLVEESCHHLYYNVAAWFAGGELRHVHRKCYLPTYGMFREGMDFARGETIRTFETPFGRAGLLICEDAWHPSTATILALQGATLVFVLSASPLRGLGVGRHNLSIDTWVQLLTTLARFHGFPVCYVNRTGFEDGLGFGGGSFATDAAGNLLASARDIDPELLLVDVPVERTRDMRFAYPLLRDERPDLVWRELGRILGREGDDR